EETAFEKGLVALFKQDQMQKAPNIIESEVAQPTEEEPSSPKIVPSSSQPTRKYSTRTGVAKE
ncbi:5777_t:CDS:2, partial [Racocetra persica]